MSVFTDIESALNTRLSTLTSLPATQWPNTKYTPTENTLFLRPTLLPAAATLNTLAGQQLHRGVYQIDIFTPLEKGVSTLTLWLDNIYTHFKANLTLTANTTNVNIQEIGRSLSQRQDAWYVASITITYICYS